MRLRKFDKGAHLRKIQQRKNRNINIEKRTIILSVLILFGAIIYFTFAKFESTKSFTLIDAKVGVFYSGYMDGVIATPPQVFEGLVPVTIDDSGETKGTIRVADKNSAWYNYAEHKWANAVIPSEEARRKSAGEIRSMDEIQQMYVWIPRYRYKLWNAEYGVSDEQAIEIEFEAPTTPKSTGSTNGSWLTHPSFTFGNTELLGIWVGKFEISCKDCNSLSDADSPGNLPTKTVIKPGLYAVWDTYIFGFYNSINMLKNESKYGLTSSPIDIHMIKNTDWGAVTYLTESKYGRYNSDLTCIESGCEMWANKLQKAGCSGNVALPSGSQCYEWNDQTYGGNTSTTGNVYGIYDLKGGMTEFVLANISNTENYTFTGGLSFGNISSKYYDQYNSNITAENGARDGKLGDATREVIKTKGSSVKTWYLGTYYINNARGSSSIGPWIVRGFGYGSSTGSIYSANSSTGGGSGSGITSRIVLTAADGS